MSKTKQVSSLSSDITLSDLSLAIEINHKRKMDELRERYQDKIKNRSDGRQVYIYINRKQISAKDKEALMDELFEINHGTENYTMNDIFPLLLLWKRDKTATKGKTLKDYSQKWEKHFKSHDIVNTPIKHLTTKHFVDLFHDWTKERKLTRKAFNNYKSIINAIFQYAINELGIPILAMGLKDAVISASPEGILVADKAQSSYIKPHVDAMDQQVMFAEKSWGSYLVLDVEESSMTVKVTLNPGHRMNYHSHDHRDEVWTVISGTGRTIVDGMEQPVRTGDVITMAAGCRHTVIAETKLQMIEVQLGRDISAADKLL